LNGLDSWARDQLKWSNTGTANTMSFATAYLLSPLVGLGLNAFAAGHDHHLSNFYTDGWLIAEATLVAANLSQFTKFAVGRERPFVHDLSPAEKSNTAQPTDNNLSFFSGHTTVAFAIAASSGTLASLRGYRAAPLVWAVAMPVACISSYLRIAADRHYLTDVLVGAVVGTGVGVAIPWLLHPRIGSVPVQASLSLGSSYGERTFVISGAW
jgi:membrane-associated phospholipid phosphatase